MSSPPNPHGNATATPAHRSNAQERLLQRIPAATWAVDLERCVTSVGGRAVTEAGERAAAYVGMPLADLCGEATDPARAIQAHEAALGGAPTEFHFTWRARDYLAYLEPIRDDLGQVVGCVGAALDVTGSNRVNGRLDRAIRFRHAMTTLVEEAPSSHIDERYYRKVVEVAVNTVNGAHAGSIWLLGEDGLCRAVASVGFDQPALARVALKPEHLQRGVGTREQLMRALAALERRDPAKHALLAVAGPVHAIQASIGLPVAVNGETLAYLHLHNLRHREPFASDETMMARMFAGNLALLLQRFQLEERLRAGRQRLERLLREYQQLAAFSAEIETIHDTNELIERGMSRLLDALRFDTAMFSEVGADSLEFTRLRGKRPALLVETLRRPLPLGEGVNGRVAQTGEPMFVHDYRAWPQRYPAYVPTGVESMLSIPIRRDGKVRHTISFATLDRMAPMDENATQVARAFVARLENAFERVKHLDEIKATREATFRALGIALEYRDLETRGHTDRVVDLARRFAAVLDLDATQTQAFVWGAYLHDIGKIAVPDTILLKPDRLTEDEFAVIRQHTLYGSEMTRAIPFLPAETRQVVRSHHERWDGRGYPDRLAADDIPLLARMFALVDVYDALTSARPYKPAWTHEAAVTEVRDQAGKQFAPGLVEAFVQVVAGA